MYDRIIGLTRARIRNDRAEKLVYIYVNLKSLQRVGEIVKERELAIRNQTPIFKLPKLAFDILDDNSENQDRDLYGSLSSEAVARASENFVDDDSVHELFDVMAGTDDGQPYEEPTADPVPVGDAEGDNTAWHC